MIRVNLAKSRSGSGKSASASAFGGGFGAIESDVRRDALVRLFIMFLFPIALWYYESENIPELKARANKLNIELTQLKKHNAQLSSRAEEIKKLKEEQAKIEAQINRILKLSKDRLTEIKVIEAVQNQMSERIWLTKMEINNQKLTLSGIAMGDYELSGFIETLTNSAFYSEVNLKNSVEQEFEKNIVKKFEIECGLEKL